MEIKQVRPSNYINYERKNKSVYSVNLRNLILAALYYVHNMYDYYESYSSVIKDELVKIKHSNFDEFQLSQSMDIINSVNSKCNELQDGFNKFNERDEVKHFTYQFDFNELSDSGLLMAAKLMLTNIDGIYENNQ